MEMQTKAELVGVIRERYFCFTRGVCWPKDLPRCVKRSHRDALGIFGSTVRYTAESDSARPPFEGDWSTILKWLQKEPDVAASTLLERLQSANPGKYADDKTLRTLQR
jgi:hypothetical protein